MIRLFCKGRHHSAGAGVCAQCSELESYALARLRKCRYGEAKPVCKTCATHCYQPEYRERIREAMRYGGPRMLLRHPVLSILHLLRGAVR
jgi:hypothetical protein